MNREVMFRPLRSPYVLKKTKSKVCPFCEGDKHIKERERSSLRVFESAYSLVIVNKYPYNSGHVLVVSKRHCSDLLLLREAEYTDLFQVLKKALKALQDVYQPQGVNIGLNKGDIAGAGIPEHLHFHLIPRWLGDANFFPLVAKTKVVIETVEMTYERLFDYFQRESKKKNKTGTSHGLKKVKKQRIKSQSMEVRKEKHKHKKEEKN